MIMEFSNAELKPRVEISLLGNFNLSINGHLIPDKPSTFKEIYRILKPGGHIQIADIVLSKPVSSNSKKDPHLWAECIVGAEPVDEYVNLIRQAGFRDVTVIDRLDYFDQSANENTKKAAKGLGAHTIVLTGKK